MKNVNPKESMRLEIGGMIGQLKDMAESWGENEDVLMAMTPAEQENQMREYADISDRLEEMKTEYARLYF